MEHEGGKLCHAREGKTCVADRERETGNLSHGTKDVLRRPVAQQRNWNSKYHLPRADYSVTRDCRHPRVQSQVRDKNQKSTGETEYQLSLAEVSG